MRKSIPIIFLLVFAACVRLAGNDDSLFHSLPEDTKTEDIKVDRDLSDNQFEYMLGELAFAEQDFKTARRHYDRALAHNTESTSPALRGRLALLCMRDGLQEEALQHVTKALSGNPDDIQLLKLQAGILTALKREKEALTIYSEILAKNQDDPDTTLLLAALYAKTNNNNKAIELLEGYLKKAKESETRPFAMHFLGKLYAAKKDYPQALKMLDQALRASPDVLPVLMDKIRVLALTRKTQEAISLARAVLQNDPTNAEAQQILAQLLIKEKRFDDALNIFQPLLETGSLTSETGMQLAMIKIQNGDLSGAATDLEILLAASPDNHAARYYLATVYAGLERTEQATSQLRLIPATSPLFKDSRVLSALLWQKVRKNDNASESLEEILKVFPEDVKVLSLLLALQKQSGNLARSLETVDRIIALQPKDPTLYMTKAAIAEKMGNSEMQFSSLKKALALAPDYADALNYIGYTLAEKGEDLDDAKAYIERALKTDPDNGYYLDSLAWVYYQQGDYQLALVTINKALIGVADDPVIVEHQALILWKIGRLTDALTSMEKALTMIEKQDEVSRERLNSAINKLKSELE